MLYFVFNIIFLFSFLTETLNYSFCLSYNKKTNIDEPDPKLTDCYYNYEYDNSTYCCLLTIIEK